MEKHHRKDNPSRIEMSERDAERLIAEIRTGRLSSETQELLVSILLGWHWLNQQLESKSLSIKKLLRLFFCSKTEKSKRTGKPGGNGDSKGGSDNGKPDPPPKPPESKPKGHGKTG